MTICFEILRKLEAGREELQTLREEKSLSFSSFQSHTAEPPVTLRGERILGNYERRRLTCWRQTHEERVSCEPGEAFSCQVTLWEQVSHPLRLSLISEETRCHRRFLLIRPRHLQHQPLPHTPTPPHTHAVSRPTGVDQLRNPLGILWLQSPALKFQWLCLRHNSATYNKPSCCHSWSCWRATEVGKGQVKVSVLHIGMRVVKTQCFVVPWNYNNENKVHLRFCHLIGPLSAQTCSAGKPWVRWHWVREPESLVSSEKQKVRLHPIVSFFLSSSFSSSSASSLYLFGCHMRP